MYMISIIALSNVSFLVSVRCKCIKWFPYQHLKISANPVNDKVLTKFVRSTDDYNLYPIHHFQFKNNKLRKSLVHFYCYAFQIRIRQRVSLNVNNILN